MAATKASSAQQLTYSVGKLGGSKTRNSVTVSRVTPKPKDGGGTRPPPASGKGGRGDRSFKGKSSLRCKQISGFACCLSAALSRVGFACNQQILIEHLQKLLEFEPDDQLAKVFKRFLAEYFSRGTCQELPEGCGVTPTKLFPGFIQRWITKHLRKSGRHRLKFLWNLLQCKDLANPVPKEMIREAYSKHAKVLSSVGSTPKHILELMRPYFRDFFEGCKFIEKTYLPPQTAYYHSKRSEGGCLSYLQKQGILRPNNFYDWKSNECVEPVVIHLTGPTGVGKSHLSRLIAAEISRRFGFSIPNVYEKPIACEFWDGYSRQLVSTIDDAFSLTDDGAELSQLLQICSPIKTVLPMADLKNKGMTFTSPFLIITSNHVCGVGVSSIRNMEAVKRRITPAYRLLRRSNRTYTYQMEHFGPQNGEQTVGPTLSLELDKLLKLIVESSLTAYENRNCSGTIRQDIITNSLKREEGLSLRFPIYPPEVNCVKAVAIPEPLKVRMITKGQELSWLLKPIQKMLWNRLGDYKCFELTHGPKIDLDFISSWEGKSGVFVSGDYEAATDNLHMDIMELAIEMLCPYVPERYHSWLRWEAHEHDIEYPTWTELPKIRQTRGQLMGSLLSFPILCLANAAILGITMGKDLKDLQALINGDDILFCARPRKVRDWKKNTKLIGLKPSVGKNYESNKFCSINSQLLIRDERGNFELAATGGFKGACGKDHLSNIKISLQLDSYETTVLRFKRVLQKTPQSIDIPTEFGGLGYQFNGEPTNLDKRIYMYLLCKHHMNTLYQTSEYLISRIPNHLLRIYGNVLGGSRRSFVELPDEPTTELKCFDFKEFKHFNKVVDRTPSLRERLRNMDLTKEVPLNLIRSSTILLKRSDESILSNLRMRI